MLTHQIHTTKAGSDHLTLQEREMHAEIVRLNKITVDLNNENYKLMKEKESRDQKMHEDLL